MIPGLFIPGFVYLRVCLRFVRALQIYVGSTHAQPVVDSEGRFSLSNVVPGKVQLALYGPSGDSANTVVDVAPGQHLADLRLQLRPAAIGGPERSANASE